MENRITIFIREFSRVSDRINERALQEVDFWLPSSPPAIPILGAIGQEISENFGDFSEIQKRELLSLIEQYLVLEDEDISSAIATGLIEGLLHKAEDEDKLSEVLLFLGPESRKYAEAWLRFTGN